MEPDPRAPVRGRLVLPGLAIAYAPLYAPPALHAAGIETGIRGPEAVVVVNWVAVLVLLAFVRRVEGLPLASILLERPSRADLGWAVVFAAVAVAVQVATTVVVALPPNEGVDTILALPLAVIVAIVLTTATTEEILYRGYVIERLAVLTGRLWPGVAASVVAFVLPHVAFFGEGWLVSNGASVVLLYALYVWRRNLPACMAMHLLGNSLVLVPALGFG